MLSQFLSNMFGNIIGAIIGTFVALVVVRYNDLYDKAKKQSEKCLQIAKEMNAGDNKLPIEKQNEINNRWAEFDELSNSIEKFHPGIKGLILAIKTCICHR